MTRSRQKKLNVAGSGLRAGAWYALALALVALGIMGYLWPQHRIVELGYSLEALEAKKAEQQGLHRMLSLEAASLSSLDRVERIATTQLGMVFPKPGQVRIVRNIPERTRIR